MAGREYCMAPSYQVWKKVPATLSPCLKRFTCVPMETDLTRTVGERDEIVFHGAAEVGAVGDEVVAEVEAGGVDADEDLVCGG